MKNGDLHRFELSEGLYVITLVTIGADDKEQRKKAEIVPGIIKAPEYLAEGI